jgi:hypothetical protein
MSLNIYYLLVAAEQETVVVVPYGELAAEVAAKLNLANR